MEKPKLKDAIEYVNRVAQDGKSISVFWKYVERHGLLPPHHHSFDGEYFVRCLKVVMAKIGTGEVGKGALTEGPVRRGGTKPHPSTPRPDIKPPGQKPTKRVLKRLITYNDRVVGPS